MKAPYCLLVNFIPVRSFLTILLVSFGFVFSAHSQIIQRVQKTRYTENLDWEKLSFVNKKTGETLSKNDFNDLVQTHPGIVLDRSINKWGELDTLFWDPDNMRTDGRRFRNEELQPKPGQYFPEFVFTTHQGNVYDSRELSDSLILLRFDFFPNTSKASPLNTQLAGYPGIRAFLCFSDDNLAAENDHFSRFEIISRNSRNFQEKFNIVVPTTFLLDENKKVIAQFRSNEEIDLSKYLRN